MSTGDTSEVMLNGKLVKPLSSDYKMPTNANTRPLSELRVVDVGTLLDCLDIGEFKDLFEKNKIDGKSLMRCSTLDEVKEMGIPITVKAKLLFEQIREFQANGFPLEYVQNSTQVCFTCTIVVIIHMLTLLLLSTLTGCDFSWRNIR